MKSTPLTANIGRHDLLKKRFFIATLHECEEKGGGTAPSRQAKYRLLILVINWSRRSRYPPRVGRGLGKLSESSSLSPSVSGLFGSDRIRNTLE